MGARVVPSPWERKFFYFFFRERRNFPKCVENLISRSAGMAELADALDSGSSEGFLHAGSSPVSRTPRALKARCFQGSFFVSLRENGSLLRENVL